MELDIVIIDDAPFIREAIRSIVENQGMRVIAEAGTGTEALRVLEKHEPDVVIMDLVMPEMNGLTVVKKILEQKPHLRILACTTETQKEMALAALNAGCKEFIGKPFDTESMIKKIKKVAKA